MIRQSEHSIDAKKHSSCKSPKLMEYNTALFDYMLKVEIDCIIPRTIVISEFNIPRQLVIVIVKSI